jgi:hypothetical protein
VKTAAETLRPNPKLKAEQVITELGVGEALVSLLDEKGRPSVVERAFIVPPASQIGPLPEDERQRIIRSSSLLSKYEKTVDRESAYEKLTQRAEEKPVVAQQPAEKPAARQPQSVVDATIKSAARAIGSELGRQIIRGVLGSILGSGRRR